MSQVRDAKPEHFKVDRTGGLPANGAYFVLDLVNDFEARVALAKLGSNYERIGQDVRAQEAFQALKDSAEAHAAVCEARNPRAKSSRAKREDIRP